MTETWRDVPGWDGRYSVSDMGRVRVNYGGRGAGVLRPFNQWGREYLRVSLYDANGKLTQRGIHQLVMWAFIGPQAKGIVVNHIDGNPANNALLNLEYCTPKQNSQHASRLGICARNIGERNGMAKLALDEVMDIKGLLRDGASNKELAKEFQVNKATILAIRNGRNWAFVPSEYWSREGELAIRAAM